LVDEDDEELLEEGVDGDPFSEAPFNFANLPFFSFLAAVVYGVISSCAGNLILVSILEAPMECSKRWH